MHNSAHVLEANNQMDHDILVAMRKPSPLYWLALAACVFVVMIGGALWGYQILVGMGAAGKNNPVGWAMYITTFVFWVGIAHSGTLISAVLLLFRAKFRSRFNRSAEAMTIFAIMTAGLFPLIHLGRVWFFYFIMPYPNQRQIWSNFRSPLVWDVFAISTYLTISLVFFYVGMIPDFAIIRQRATGIRKWIYGVLSLGWRGTETHWRHYNQLCIFLAALATPLVVSVHSIVSWDFAMSVLPGWHTTIFAHYFVAGAIFSGTAMVFTLVIPMRKIFHLEKYITLEHFESLTKLLLVTSLIVTYAYIVEFFIAFYSGNVFEKGIFIYRATGYYAFGFWTMVFCNCVAPLILFIRKMRRNLVVLFIVSILINIGMWFERFVIIVTTLSHDFLPYAWGTYKPTLVDMGIVIASFAWFFLFFLLFVKTLPILAITEVKEVNAKGEHHA